jgi:hypothetical protein
MSVARIRSCNGLCANEEDQTMTKFMRRVRGALGTGLTWAAGWAVFGVLIGVMSNLIPGPWWISFFDVFDAPLPALAMPGFIGGVLFSIVLASAGHNRKFSELSIPRFAAWGAVGGFLLSLIPAALVAAGLANTDGAGRGVLELTAIIAPPLVIMSALSAAGSLWLARRAEKKAALEAGRTAELGTGPYDNTVGQRPRDDSRLGV